MKLKDDIVYTGDFTIQDLIDAKVHLGHREGAWNPENKSNIYGSKNGIHIIDVRKPYVAIQNILDLFYKFGKNGKKILFVGTNPQVSGIVREYAEKCGQYYINDRWLGGILTNWYTVSKSIKTLLSYDKVLADPESGLIKKEMNLLKKRRDKLYSSFGGIMNMKGLPDLVFVVNTIKDHLAVKEASKLGVPVVAIVDTNCSSDGVTNSIPGNDDGVKAVQLYCKLICEAVMAGVKDEMAESGIDVEKILEKKGKRGFDSLKPIEVVDGDSSSVNKDEESVDVCAGLDDDLPVGKDCGVVSVEEEKKEVKKKTGSVKSGKKIEE